MARAAYTLGCAGGSPDWEGEDAHVSCLRVKWFSWAQITSGGESDAAAMTERLVLWWGEARQIREERTHLTVHLPIFLLVCSLSPAIFLTEREEAWPDPPETLW